MGQYILYTTLYNQEILEEIKELEEEELTITWPKVQKKGQIIELDFSLEEQQLENLAQALSDVVQKQVIIESCECHLNKRDDLSKIEKEEIKKAFMTNNYLSRQEGYSSITYYLIYMPIFYMLREKKTMNIEGWIKFRTKKYRVLLEDLLEQFIADYMVKKDIIGFIKVMREISSLSAPLEEILHIVYEQEGQIKVYNKEKKDVTISYISKYCKDLVLDSTLSKEDLVMNILITTCPNVIMIHGKQYAKEPQFLKTLELIFDNQIKYCKGCSLCL